VATSTPIQRTRTQRAAKPAKTVARPTTDPVIRLEIYGIIVSAFALAFLLSLVSFDPTDVGSGRAPRASDMANWLGPVGANIANLFLGGFGLGSFVIAIGFGWLGVTYILGRRARMGRVDVVGGLLAVLSFIVLAHTIGKPGQVLGHPPGGSIGAWLGEVSASLFSTPGTVLLFLALGVVAAVLLTRRSIFELASGAVGGGGRFVRWLVDALRHGDADLAEEEEVDAAEPAIHQPKPLAEAAPATRSTPKVATAKTAPATPTADAPNEPQIVISETPARPAVAAPTVAKEAPKRGEKVAVAKKASPQSELELPAGPPADDDDMGGIRIVESEAMRKPPVIKESLDEDEDDVVPARAALPVLDGVIEDDDDDEDDELDGHVGIGGDDDEDDEDGPRVVAPRAALPAEVKPFVLPSLSILDYRPPETMSYDRELLKKNAQILEAKLLDYKVKGRVTEIHPGPVITMYEFLPAPGIKISSIANLSDDLAMALSALRIRIVAPIPGKNVVGIEVPNAARETVWLKEILSDESYARAKSKMTLALGKDITGHPTCMDLAKAPHLLVAGSTGSGKSVAINSFVVSLLYKAEPSDVRVIMVDPKMLELSIYEGIPHLLLPVVTDPKQAATALKWAVKEMTRRYQLMADMGVRNLAGYNAKVQQLLEEPGHPLPERLRLAKLKREAKGQVDPKGAILDCDGKPVERLPCIVVIIDELADLMMVASKEVETCIARLAQMARASGIHLILATQRPSVDVLTGLIKANFPTRISFQVASKTDSRTILDRNGAEALLGMGDMLFMPPGTGGIKRVHGCYVSEEEVHRIVAHLKEQGSPEYDMGILVSDDDEDGKAELPTGGNDSDELYDQAVRIAAENRQVSTSFLQRKLKIGYNRAARIIEMMEEQGIVGPSDGTSRPREVFIDPI
jgi:S-DNA-T family DNA segregation ATPase FtsK/SpoIIIE